MIAKGVAATFVGVTLLAAYLAGVALATGLAPETPIEASLSSEGVVAYRVVSSSLPVLGPGHLRPDVVVLASPASLNGVERVALRGFVEAGGDLWILSPSPADAVLWDGLADAIAVYPGYLFASDGSKAKVRSALGGGLSGASSLLALDLRRGEFEPLILTAPDAFRDTSGNGVLEAGEPNGPFVVGAAALVGDGRVVVLATVEPQDVGSWAVPILLTGRPTVERASVHDGAVPGAWAASGRSAYAFAAVPSVHAPAMLLVAILTLGCLLPFVGSNGRGAAREDGPTARLLAEVRARLEARADPQSVRILALFDEPGADSP